MTQLCPVCGVPVRFGGSPKSHKNYTSDRGRSDIDFNRCLSCFAYWDQYHYVKEGITEIKFVHLKDGRHWVDGEAVGAPILCPFCHSDDVWFEHDDGAWRNQHAVRQLRYECKACNGMWVAMTRLEDRVVLATRVWRKGVIK